MFFPTPFSKSRSTDLLFYSYEVFPDRGGNNPVASASHYLQTTLLNHQFTVNAAASLKTAADFLSKNRPGIPLILGEIGSGLAGGDRGSIVTRQIEGSLGTAVWTLDFHLYCMSIGIAGISNQVGKANWSFAPFESSPSQEVPTAVRPTWYGVVAAVDFLGSATSQASRVSQLSIPGAPNMTAYASFQGDDLSSIALLNLQLWVQSTDPKTERPSVTVQLTDLPSTVQSVHVKRLTGPGSLALDGVTWGGESWTYQSDGKAVQTGPGAETLQVKQGVVKVVVGATEAVVLSLVR